MNRVRKYSAIATAVITLFFSVYGAARAAGLPPGEADAKTRLLNSPRHGEWARVDAGGGDMVDLWVVFPERKDPAPVVIVIQEIFGLTDWIRAVADQLAADGFIAVAPDFLCASTNSSSASVVRTSPLVTRNVLSRPSTSESGPAVPNG